MSGKRNGRDARHCLGNSVECELWHGGERHDQFTDRSIEEYGRHQLDDFERDGKRHGIHD